MSRRTPEPDSDNADVGMNDRHEVIMNADADDIKRLAFFIFRVLNGRTAARGGAAKTRNKRLAPGKDSTMEGRRHNNLLTLVEGAIIAAIAMVLSFIPIEMPNAAFDLSLGLIPLSVYAVRRGALPAVAVGAVWGLLHLVGGKAYILSIPQFILEYPFAFAFGGLFGLFAKRIRTALASAGRASASVQKSEDGGNLAPDTAGAGKGVAPWIILASLVCTLSRWFWHFVAGGVVWAEYAPSGTNPWLYSLMMNGASFVANAVMLIVVMLALVKVAPRLFRT
jgi:thiamine transporter